MIRLTRQTQYACRVILFLAQHPPGARFPSSVVRDEMLIPPAFSAQIIAELAHGEFIQTFPGREGGIQLARKAEKISMWDILNFFEGPVYLSDCLIEKQGCPFGDNCSVRLRLSPLQELLRMELEKITFNELALDTKKSEAWIQI